MIEWCPSKSQMFQGLRTHLKMNRLGIRTFRRWGLLAAAMSFAAPVGATEVYRQGETAVRWDNTLKYSGGLRLDAPLRALIRGANGDDGDRNFQPGFISNRFDLLSEIIVSGVSGSTSWGAAVSGAAWYDTVYNGGNDGAKTEPPGFYVLPGTFAGAVRDLHGRKAELLNAFAYVGFDAGGNPLTLRVGRHTLLWGESLFFAGNGIAAGQAPVDAIKALSVPVTPAKEIYMPVAQISATFQPLPDGTLAAYYQFEWRKTRLPGAGSYFSAADFLDAGGERIYVGAQQYLMRSPDRRPPDNGQFGASLRVTGGAFDYGFYALRFHAREPQLYLQPNPAAPTAERRERPAAYGTAPGIVYGPSNSLNVLFPGGFGPTPGVVGSYWLTYPRGIELYGASASGYVGNSNVAGEISLRRRMPLVSSALVVAPGAAPDADNNPLYARGNTLHAQVSTVMSFAPTAFWNAASFSAEIAANHRLKVTHNPGALDATRDRSAAAVGAVFEPRYFAVLPGLDLGAPLSLSYGLKGRSSVDGSQTEGTGSVSLGVSATYRAVWSGSLSVTHFVGGASRQPFTDRDFISFSVQRTF